MRRIAAAAAAMAMLFAGGCSVRQGEEAKDQPRAYVIGMGEIMGQNQMRHGKLWFAGREGNWPLAQYEVDELREGFDDVKSFHPTFKKTPTAPLIDEFVARPFDDLDKAIKARSNRDFTTAFDDLTAGCNGCHKQLEFGFNVIKRPTSPPFTNQDYAPPAEQR